MRRVLETAMILMGTLGFWGFVYPEFCLTQETCQVEECEDEISEGEEEICIKSRFLEYVYLVKEKTDREKDDNNDRQKCAHWGV